MTPSSDDENRTAAEPDGRLGRALKPRPLRRIGAVIDADETRLRIWISGVTGDGSAWVAKEHLPATLHTVGATFDVWLYDDEPLTQGAYTPQVSPATGRPYTE